MNGNNGKEARTVDDRLNEEYEQDVADWMRHATGEFEGMAAAVQREADRNRHRGLRAWLTKLLTGPGDANG